MKYLLFLLALLLVGCSPSPYWQTSNEYDPYDYTYYKKGWPKNTICPSTNSNPTKESTYNRLRKWRPKKTGV